MRHIRRALLAATLLGWLPAAHSQKRVRTYFVGILGMRPEPSKGTASASFKEVLRQTLGRTGFVVGKNLRIESVMSDPGGKALRRAAQEILAYGPDAIVALDLPPARILQQLTTSIPIVFARVGDPVGIGLVVDLARPGLNITGVGTRYDELSHKRLELGHTLLPAAKRVAIVYPARELQTMQEGINRLQASADALKLSVIHGDVSRHGNDVAAALTHVRAAGPDFLMSYRLRGSGELLSAFELEHRIPHISDGNAKGILAVYIDMKAHLARAAEMVSEILRGRKPGDIPIDFTNRAHVVANAAIAKAIGITLPPAILVAATRLQ